MFQTVLKLHMFLLFICSFHEMDGIIKKPLNDKELVELLSVAKDFTFSNGKYQHFAIMNFKASHYPF